VQEAVAAASTADITVLAVGLGEKVEGGKSSKQSAVACGLWMFLDRWLACDKPLQRAVTGPI